jgi:hypothetical protein
MVSAPDVMVSAPDVMVSAPDVMVSLSNHDAAVTLARGVLSADEG